MLGRSLLLTILLLAPASVFAAPKAPTPISKAYKELIRKNHRDFDRCAQVEVKRTKKPVKGMVLVRFTVNGDGKVTDSGFVHNTTKSKFIADCVVKGVEGLHFPANFGAPVTSTYPFKFNVKK
jgi:hypothetical protein